MRKSSLLKVGGLLALLFAATALIVHIYPEEQHASGVADANRFDSVQDRIAALEGRLDKLAQAFENRTNKLSALQGELSDLQARTAEIAASARQAREMEEVRHSQARELSVPMSEQQLRLLIAEIISQEHEVREAEKQRLIEERAAARQDLAHGPYGRHNYKVNSMIYALNLSPDQAERYYELVDKYHKIEDALRNKVYAEIDGTAMHPEQMREKIGGFLLQKQDLNRAIERELSAIFDSDQLEVYQNLPSHERSILGPDVLVENDFVDRALW